MNFAEKLKKLRQEKEISQAKLAEEIFVSRSAVAKWENGLGLPSDESLQLLAEYFQVDAVELIADQQTEKTIVSQNKTIENQGNIIAVMACALTVIFLAGSYILIPGIREYISMIVTGIFISVLGIFNIKGNIASIHWYNRRKVSRENQLIYCRIMGTGTLITGLTIAVAPYIQILTDVVISSAVVMTGVAVGLGFMLYAQIKYNRGLF